MSIRYKFKQAKKIINNLSPESYPIVKRVCLEIQEAEILLGKAARENLNRCYHQCEGLCCRNVQIDTILSHWDFVYILILAGSVDDTIARCLKKENLLYSADCIFLENGIGPCIFPEGVRPEICIVGFCTEAAAISREIRAVKKKFFRLSLTVTLLPFKKFLRRFSFKAMDKG